MVVQEGGRALNSWALLAAPNNQCNAILITYWNTLNCLAIYQTPVPLNHCNAILIIYYNILNCIAISNSCSPQPSQCNILHSAYWDKIQQCITIHNNGTHCSVVCWLNYIISIEGCTMHIQHFTALYIIILLRLVSPNHHTPAIYVESAKWKVESKAENSGRG